jgi:single-stranded DNA-binding protein
MKGINDVTLQGQVVRPNYKLTTGNYPMFRCRIAVPLKHKFPNGDEIEKNNHINLVAWGDMADSMKNLKQGQAIKVIGNLQQRKFDSKCRLCDGPQTVWFTDVLVNNFLEVE